MQLGSKLYFIIGICIVIPALLFGGWRVYQTWSQRQWQTNQRLTLAWFPDQSDIDSDIYIISYADQSITILRLPKDVKLKISRGYGYYPIRSLWQLGQQEHDTRILTESLTSLISSPVEYWLSSPRQCQQPTDCLKSQLRAWAFKSQNTNLPIWDRFRLWQLTRSLRSDQIISIDGEGTWAQTQLAPDGIEEIVFNRDVVDARLAEKFIDPQIRTQNQPITVINTIGTRGLANDISRIIQGWGGLVISTYDNPTSLDTCLIRTSSLADTTALKLSQFFECQLEAHTEDNSEIQFWIGQNNQIWSSQL